jgi:hypothetical protein
MAYSDFTLDAVRKAFGLTLKRAPLFATVDSVDVPQWLTALLEKGRPLAFSSEKARSEFILVPILLASRELHHDSFSIYSGERLDSDPSRGLNGECDFILTNTPPLPVIQAPIVVIVEAKKNDIEAGLGQCVAQMVGARLFNQKEGNGIELIFGCVTTGEAWQFLKLERDDVLIDSDRYYIDRVDKILGMFQAILACYTPYLTAA